MALTLRDFVQTYRDAAHDRARHLDGAIFDLFRRHPGHGDAAVVFAKVVLVNRVYRTNIHRKGTGVEWKLAEHLVKKGREVDGLLRAVRRAAPFRLESLDSLGDAHQRLAQIMSEKTRRHENSFCSKYLSFHFPTAAPIFDKWAYQSAWALVGDRFERGRHRGKKNRAYRLYCDAVLLLIEHLHAHRVTRVDLKQLDKVLYRAR